MQNTETGKIGKDLKIRKLPKEKKYPVKCPK